MATSVLAPARSRWPRLASSAALSLVTWSVVLTAAPAQRAPSWASDGLTLARACDLSPYGRSLAAQLTKGGERTPAPASDPASAPGRLLARAEVKPSDAAPRLELARCFVSRSEFAVAREHVARAIEIIRQARAANPPMEPAAPAPVKKFGPAPEYPAKLGKNVNGLTGLVFVDVDVDTQGKVGKAKVVGSIPEFDAEALSAVKQWTFTPPSRVSSICRRSMRAPRRPWLRSTTRSRRSRCWRAHARSGRPTRSGTVG